MAEVDIILIGSSWGAEPGDVITVDEDRAAGLVDKGAARYLEDGELVSPAPEEVKPPTAAEVLADVGEDADKARAALDAEKAAKRPRKGLVAKLEEILDAG